MDVQFFYKLRILADCYLSHVAKRWYCLINITYGVNVIWGYHYVWKGHHDLSISGHSTLTGACLLCVPVPANCYVSITSSDYLWHPMLRWNDKSKALHCSDMKPHAAYHMLLISVCKIVALGPFCFSLYMLWGGRVNPIREELTARKQ